MSAVYAGSPQRGIAILGETSGVGVGTTARPPAQPLCLLHNCVGSTQQHCVGSTQQHCVGSTQQLVGPYTATIFCRKISQNHENGTERVAVWPFGPLLRQNQSQMVWGASGTPPGFKNAKKHGKNKKLRKNLRCEVPMRAVYAGFPNPPGRSLSI